MLWNGTTFEDMTRMTKACQRFIDKNLREQFRVDDGYPFWERAPKSNSDYWKKFDEISDYENVCCGIVGLTAPSHHWVVIYPDTERRVWFADSGRGELEYRKNLASLYAGERRRAETQWKLDRRELIVFYHVV